MMYRERALQAEAEVERLQSEHDRLQQMQDEIDAILDHVPMTAFTDDVVAQSVLDEISAVYKRFHWTPDTRD